MNIQLLHADTVMEADTCNGCVHFCSFLFPEYPRLKSSRLLTERSVQKKLRFLFFLERVTLLIRYYSPSDE